MATQHSRTAARFMVAPSVILLFLWMIVPLVTTIYFSFIRYKLLDPTKTGFAGFNNYIAFINNPSFTAAIWHTLAIVLGVLLITVIGGILLALLMNMEFWGQGVVRVLVIAPFFVMPTVSALVWKNMFMNPVNGMFAHIAKGLGMQPYDFLSQAPLLSIIGIVAWQWLPFATLILLTSLQSLDGEQQEAAEMDGANWINRFWYLTVPHLTRAVTVVILIQTIFLLSVFAEIFVTTSGGPGTATTTITYLVYIQSLVKYDVGIGSAGGIIAVILANIVAVFVMRMIGKNLDA
jgi:sorbitol/mannitol transport system permease protein